MEKTVKINDSSDYKKNAALESGRLEGKDKGFDSLLKSAMGMVNEASDLQNQAEEAEVQFMLGYATNTHDLQAIQEKADIALNYTIAVRDRMIESYKEIMNMQI